MLRGATVGADGRRVATVLRRCTVLALVAVAAVLTVAGADKNAQVTDLRSHGIDVAVTVTACRGLLGGSGSNSVGYSCTGTYRVDGRSFTQGLPGSTLLAPGSRVTEVVAAGDPELLSSPALVAAERPSARVYLVPAVLLATILALLLAPRASRRRRRKARGYDRVAELGGV